MSHNRVVDMSYFPDIVVKAQVYGLGLKLHFQQTQSYSDTAFSNWTYYLIGSHLQLHVEGIVSNLLKGYDIPTLQMNLMTSNHPEGADNKPNTRLATFTVCISF